MLSFDNIREQMLKGIVITTESPTNIPINLSEYHETDTLPQKYFAKLKQYLRKNTALHHHKEQGTTMGQCDDNERNWQCH